MAGKNHRDRIKVEDFFANTVKEERTVAAGQVPAPNSFAKQNVSTNEIAGIWKIKTKAAWAMSGHMKSDDSLTGDEVSLTFFEKNIGSDWIVLDVKSMTLEKAPIRNHGNGIWMTDDLATMPSLDFARIHHMIEVSVSENKPIDFLMREVGIGRLRRIEKDIA
jgi:hypothetical protein